MDKNSTIFISDENSLIGKSLVKSFHENSFKNVIKPNKKINLNVYNDLDNYFKQCKPEYVIICSSKSGGIEANLKYPAELMNHNMISQYNIIKLAYKYSVKKLMFIASSCIYPKEIKTPAKETDLLSGKVENSNQSYSIAKIAGIEMCRAYRIQYKANFFSVVPTNIYGPGENYNKEYMHVIPSLIKKIHNAKVKNLKSIKLLSNGKPIREFLYSNDFADACLKILKNKKKFDLINVGSSQSLNIESIAKKIKNIIKYNGEIHFSSKKYNGTNIKKLNFNKIKNIGWRPKTNLMLGLKQTYFDYLNQIKYKE